MKIVIIGAGAAGTSAATEARKINREAEITVINSEGYPEYSRCGLPYAISGEIKAFENLILHGESWYDKFGKVKLMLSTEVMQIQLDSNTIKVKHHDGSSEDLQYDSLVLATGSKPSVPPIQAWRRKEFSL